MDVNVDLESTLGWSRRGISGRHSSELGSQTTRQLVHGSKGDVEALGRRVDGRHIDGVVIPRQRVALAAVGAVPAGDGHGAADEGEFGQRAGCLVALWNETILAIGTGHFSEIQIGVIVVVIVRHADLGGRRGRFDQRERFDRGRRGGRPGRGSRPGQDCQRGGKDRSDSGESELHFA